MNEYKTVKQIHGFYVDEELKTISFDILIDFDEKDPEGIRESIIKRIKGLHPNYNFYVVIDNDFSD